MEEAGAAQEFGLMDLNLTNTLREILEAHSVHTRPDGQALAAGNMTVSAWVVEKSSATATSLVQLDINVRSPLIGARTLIESFAGWGADEPQAIKRAWANFMRSSLHVLLEVFVGDGRGENQIEWGHWDHDRTRWRICLGPLFATAFEDQRLPNIACSDLLDQLRDALLPTLSTEYHWLRFYYMQLGDSSEASECLLDNEPWEEGQNIVNRWSWPNGFYSVRLFLLLLPAP